MAMGPGSLPCLDHQYLIMSLLAGGSNTTSHEPPLVRRPFTSRLLVRLERWPGLLEVESSFAETARASVFYPSLATIRHMVRELGYQ